ncbi:MAG: hypothetical protein K0M39_12230 [Rhizobium sp.]|nr:hypothetical protein [Rhizobium sp.]
MDIPSKHVFEALQQKGVTEIHHVNSVVTACQFLRSKSLMSRGTVERLGVKQTPQSSDQLDKRYGIWFDAFADTVDIHGRASRANAYGPVMFVLDAAVIEKTYTGRVWVTKLNPTKWANKSDDARWFRDKADLDANLVKGRFDQMIVFRHSGGELPFRGFLKKIVLDDPQQHNANGVDLFSMGVGALRLAMSDSGLDIPIERRACKPNCQCTANYAADVPRTLSMFDPKV